VERPAKKVFLTESFIEEKTLPERYLALNKDGWYFILNLVKKPDAAISAFSIFIQDVGQIEPPIICFELPNKLNDLAALLTISKTMFGKFEKYVLTINGRFSTEQIKKHIEEWTLSLPKITN